MIGSGQCTPTQSTVARDNARSLVRAEKVLELGDRIATWLLRERDLRGFVPERGWAHEQQLNQLLLSAWALNGLGYAAMQRGDLGDALAWYERYTPLIRDTENGVARLLMELDGLFARA